MSESQSSHSPTSPSPQPGASPSPSRASQHDQIRDRGDAGYNKSLKNRHLQMIAIGGSIGTGLFMGAGGRLKDGGAGLMFAYAVCGVFAFLMVRALGELAIRRPSSGAFVSYAREFLGEKGAYITGWFFFLDWSVTVMADITAVALYLHYWTALKVVPQWVFALIALVLVFILNMLNVKMFGEAEFWFALIKVAAIVSFMVVAIVAIVLGLHTGTDPHGGAITAGAHNILGNGGFFPEGFPIVFALTLGVVFAFGGTEMVGVAAGEARNPRRDVPKAIHTVFWRIMIFYIGAITVIGFLIAFNDSRPLPTQTEDVASSPFTLVFERAGIGIAAALMNAVILTAVLSAGNSGLYASTRMLHSMALQGQAPAWFSYVNRHGVPVRALGATALVGAAGFLTAVVGQNTAYAWLVNVSALCGFIVWLGIAACHFRFRRAYVLQGNDPADLPYQAPWFPLGPVLAFTLCALVILGQNYEAVFKGQLVEVLSSYIGLPVFGAIWLGHRLVTGSRMVRLEEADVSGAVVRERS